LSKAKDDILDIGRGLTMHRHWGFDIILVTQKPDLLNAFVKAACSEHLILRAYSKWN
jgi:zona occludens toxin (predicted ATPase)